MRFLLPLSIICISLLFAWWLVSSAQLANVVAEKERPAQAVLPSHRLAKVNTPHSDIDTNTLPFVRTKVFRPARWVIPLEVSGVVKSATQVSLIAEVDGQIRTVHPAVKANGLLRKGDVVFQLYSPQVEAQLVAAQSKVQQARQQYIKTQAQLDSAGDVPGLKTPLEYRRGLLQMQRGLVDAAQSEFKLAQNQVERQKIIAPFDARVIQHDFSAGQMVRIGTELAGVFSPKLMVIDVGLSPANASLLRRSAQREGDTSVVVARAIGDSHDYFKGRLQSKRGIIDTSTGTESFKIEVSQDLKSVQLMPGEWVDVRISVQVDQRTFRVPHAYVRQGQLLSVQSQQDKFQHPQKAFISEVIRLNHEPVFKDRRFTYLKVKPKSGAIVLIENSPTWLLPGHRVRVNPGNQFNGEKVFSGPLSDVEPGA